LRGIFALVAIILILAAGVYPMAKASNAGPQYSIGVEDTSVSVSITLNILQNLTAFENSFSLPQFRGVLVGANASDVSQTVQSALQQENPQARVSNFRLDASSTAWSAAAGHQWFNISMSMNVSGVETNTNGVSHIDLSWKSFAISTSVQVGAVEVNNVGQAFLASAASDLAQQASSTGSFSQLFFQVNGKEASRFQFPSAVNSWSTLNFSSLAPPIASWHLTYTPLASSNAWSLNAAQGLGVAVVVLITEAGQQQSRAVYGLLYDLSSTVTTPRGSAVNGDVVTLSGSGIPEVAMAGVIVSTLGLWSCTFVYERRFLGRNPNKRSSRKSSK